MRKFIILFVLSLSVTYAQQGWREGVRDSLNITKSKIYDSTYTRIDSLKSAVVSEISKNTINIVDGWYADNFLVSDTVFLGRGLGRMGNSYRIMRDQYLTGVSINTSPDDRLQAGSVSFQLYKNGEALPYSLSINTTYPQMNILNIARKTLKFYGYDYVQIKAISSSSFEPDNIVDFDAVLEFSDVAIGSESDSGYTLTATAKDSGTVTLSPDKPKYSYGESVTCISTPNSGWTHSTWTGASNSMEDTITIVMTNNKTLRARFNKINPNPHYRVVVSDFIIETTNSGITWIDDPDSSHAKTVKSTFLTGYNLGYGSGTKPINTDSVIIYKPDSYLGMDQFAYADYVGAEVIVQSTGISPGTKSEAQEYYPIQMFMPVGYTNIRTEYYDGVYPSIITVGNTNEWDDYNNQGTYDVEIVADDPLQVEPYTAIPSWSNGYGAGLFVGAVDKSYTFVITDDFDDTTDIYRDYWSCRYALKFYGGDVTYPTRVPTNLNGYGHITAARLKDATLRSRWYNAISANEFDIRYWRINDPYLTQ